MNKRKKRASRWQPIWMQIKQDKRAYTVYVLLSIAILSVIVRSAFLGRWENVFTGVLASVLLLIPPVIERSFHVELPTTLEILTYVFVFCAEILGEIGNFYVHFPFWDTMLHTFNGFMFAAFGFCLVDIFNKTKRFRFELSPIFLTLVAFCFSMTIGVLWEFFEFGADMLLHTDMQKDTFQTVINSVSLPNDLGEKVTHIKDIATTTIVTQGGEMITVQGYLDIGLADTVKDLFVNLIGAIVFSVIGFFYVKHRGKGHIANQFIPVFKGEGALTEEVEVPKTQKDDK
ncbi:MAG: hypothetical protein IJC95_05370 [Clostridia bacterium]|nr:hypothetical protein [Clostridia bacterium]MBQ3056897.1 hypothetical protein [Clostridia bacterium]